jgi:hypothetical protein
MRPERRVRCAVVYGGGILQSEKLHAREIPFYTVMNKFVTEDAPMSATPILNPNISIQARFLWVLVRRFEEDRPGEPVKQSELLRIMGVGADTFGRYRDELLHGGYLQADRRREAAGRFATVQYTTLPPVPGGDFPREFLLIQDSDSGQ